MGSFERDVNDLTDRITADGHGDWPVEPGRYRLVVARACPWANHRLRSRPRSSRPATAHRPAQDDSSSRRRRTSLAAGSPSLQGSALSTRS